VKVCKGIDPFQFFTALNSKPISVLHKLAFREIDVQNLEEILALGKYIDFLVIVGHCLVEYVALGAMVHALHYFFLSVYLVVKLLLENVTFEVVLVVGLPRAGAHVAKALTACAGHEVASH
jgi:hypothetical protein